MKKILKDLKEEYKAWLVVAYKEVQDNGVQTTDYLIFTDDKNYFLNGDRLENLDVSLFKTFLDHNVAPQLNEELEFKLLEITKSFKQFLA